MSLNDAKSLGRLMCRVPRSIGFVLMKFLFLLLALFFIQLRKYVHNLPAAVIAAVGTNNMGYLLLTAVGAGAELHGL